MDSESETGSSQLSLWNRPESENGSSQLSLCNLPEELILCILKSLHIKDVLNMRAVNSIFRDMIDDCSAVWKAASFQDTWPSSKNVHYFEKAGKFGNMEALIKMAIAYLHNEGIPQAKDWKKRAVKAAELFCQIEAMTPFEPFTWVFVRQVTPRRPYLTKFMVIVYMEKYVQKSNEQDLKNLNVCVAKSLLSMNDDYRTAILPYLFEKRLDVFLSNARQLGSGCAAFLLWQREYNSIVSTDRARELEGIRQLREIATMNHFESKLSLCKMYANGEYGGITQKEAAMFVRELAQSTTPANTQECFKTYQDNPIEMRYILVNRMVEIAEENNFSGDTLHTAVGVVDRYLKSHKTALNNFTLVGVSAMHLCSRFLEEDCVTQSEARPIGYLHGSPDVVRMMGEITATVKGNIRVPNSLNFVEIFSSVAELDKKCSCLAEYVCELTLLHVEMGHHSSAEIAASSVLLARLLMKLDSSWPDKMMEFSGFTIEDLRCCVSNMHGYCVLQECKAQQPFAKLHAVKKRYEKEKFHKVSEIPIMSYEELCSRQPLIHHYPCPMQLCQNHL